MNSRVTDRSASCIPLRSSVVAAVGTAVSSTSTLSLPGHGHRRSSLWALPVEWDHVGGEVPAGGGDRSAG